MSERIWDRLLSEQDRAHLCLSPRKHIGFGTKPALLLVDLYRWVFGDKPEPLLGPNAMTALSGAHAVNELIRPAAVIATHVNEGATSDGKLKPTSRTAAFIKLIKRPVHLSISGRTMEFDGSAKCVAGCN